MSASPTGSADGAAGDFPDFSAMLDEVRAVLATAEEAALDSAAKRLREAPRVFLAGAGRSGLLMRMFAMRLMQLGLSAHVAGESTTPSIEAGDLLVLASGSGQTATMRALAEKARSREASILLLTYSPQSPLAAMADACLGVRVPPDPDRPGRVGGRQVLGTLFDQTVLFLTDHLVARLRLLLGVTPAEMQRRHANLE